MDEALVNRISRAFCSTHLSEYSRHICQHSCQSNLSHSATGHPTHNFFGNLVGTGPRDVLVGQGARSPSMLFDILIDCVPSAKCEDSLARSGRKVLWARLCFQMQTSTIRSMGVLQVCMLMAGPNKTNKDANRKDHGNSEESLGSSRSRACESRTRDEDGMDRLVRISSSCQVKAESPSARPTEVKHRMGTIISITNDVSAAHNLLLSKCSRGLEKL